MRYGIVGIDANNFQTRMQIFQALMGIAHNAGERSEFCVTLKTLQRHHIIQSPIKING